MSMVVIIVKRSSISLCVILLHGAREFNVSKITHGDCDLIENCSLPIRIIRTPPVQGFLLTQGEV